MRYFLALVCLIFSSYLFAATENDQLQKLLTQYSTYQAQFKQNTYDENHKLIQTSQGKFFLMRPDKFRWETNKPNPQIIVANNNVLWIYDKDLMQVTQRTIDPNSISDPAALLSGNAQNISRQFSVTMLQSNRNVTLFQLIPKQQNNNINAIRLYFSYGKLQRLILDNNLRQTSDFKFTKIKLDKKLNPQLFIFNPPPGVDVLKQ